MKKLIIRSALIFTIGFMILFGLRLGYGYWSLPNGEVLHNRSITSPYGSSFELNRKNYAGQKGGKGSIGAVPASVDQRYEKIASLGQASSDFNNDETRIREVAKDAEALIQHEQSYGLKGNRLLQLALGVSPEKFDAVINDLRAIGKPLRFQVNKVDKTNEYRTLLAQQVSLQKSRDNLIALKSNEARLNDLISLERQILELENQIQNLGVSVGEFDSEFEFVTIKLTLREVRPPVTRFISLMQRAKVALEWTFFASLGITAAFLMLMTGIALLAFIIQVARKLGAATREQPA